MRGLYGEVFDISTITMNTDESFEATVSWTPLPTDLGQKIACASAIDTSG